MIRTVLITLGGSGVSRATIEQSTRLLGSLRPTFVLLRVVPLKTTRDRDHELYEGPHPPIVPATNYVASETQRLRAQGHAAKEQVGFGEPAEEIARAAEAVKADLIVVGEGERSAWRFLRRPSVAEQVRRRSRIPVLVTPRAEVLAA